jgi:hypothetical protein
MIFGEGFNIRHATAKMMQKANLIARTQQLAGHVLHSRTLASKLAG